MDRSSPEYQEMLSEEIVRRAAYLARGSYDIERIRAEAEAELEARFRTRSHFMDNAAAGMNDLLAREHHEYIDRLKAEADDLKSKVRPESQNPFDRNIRCSMHNYIPWVNVKDQALRSEIERKIQKCMRESPDAALRELAARLPMDSMLPIRPAEKEEGHEE